MSLNNRKGGMVARIRVNPKDCLAILDVIEAIGMDPYQNSFSGCVAIALSSLIGVARKSGAIKEEEDGFQYLNRVGPFEGQVSTKVKRERTNRLYESAKKWKEPPLLQEGDIIPIHKPFDREAALSEYEYLKPIATQEIGKGNLDSKVVERFLELQNKLF